MDWQDQLISLYLLICNEYKRHLWSYCERMTNHADLSFSDEEVITIFLNGVLNKRCQLKEIYEYTSGHLRSWFPTLPGYTAFVQRINRVCDIFIPFIEELQAQLPRDIFFEMQQVIDSMPIVIAKQGRRFRAKAANEIATPNGYCATKKMYYYGVKLQVIGAYKKSHLPIPMYIGLTNAGIGDRKAYEQILPELHVFPEEKALLYTPVKKQKGQKILDSADKLLSSAISSIRQPIESLFNWIQEKTNIQVASKVRSYNGLMVHVFGRITAAFLMLIKKFGS